jgi:hypothetical protein
MRSPTGSVRRRRAVRRTFVAVGVTAMLSTVLPTMASAQELPITEGDPRLDLPAGFDEARSEVGLEQVGFFDKRTGPFFDSGSLSSNVGLAINTANSDMAFTGDHVLHGNWQGFQVYDVSDPTNPILETAVRCPGGQGDVNVYGNLVFTSVEGANGRVDCGAEGNAGGAQESRMRGVRIWDISDISEPVQVATIQTCRGSHTNRLVEDPNDPDHVYIYNNGTAGQRNADEAVHTPEGFRAGRCGQGLDSENPSTHMIEIIKVPVANPEAAEVVNEARLFADEETGAVDGLLNTPFGTPHPCASDDLGSCTPAGSNYSPNPNTNTCHDITAYPEIGLAAGACQGNGILIDISDPANPVRLDDVADPNFAYWHSANFSNDGSKVMFTDEWGGGTGARCAPNHRTSWGANALFSIDRSGDTPQMVFESYYKLPVAQENTENCVAHQANIVPVPGRDILVQAWYQGGISMFDWTDPANPFEIAHFDRGPINADALVLAGHWSGYWYNGQVYGAEIARGLDVTDMTPTEHLTANEIAAANTVVLDEHNAMSMRRIEWEPSFEVVRAYRDQAERAGLRANHVRNVDKFLERAERFQSGPQARAAVAQLNAVANQVRGDAPDLANALNDLAGSLG